ncbi:MAG: DUF550 domain-containing protein [Mesorhizobium sp.]|nr:MAG: DUF550 domain-containing protein [Mesorhizobium sp.]
MSKFLNLIAEQIGWSRRNFGEGTRVGGNTAHVLKEVLEFRREPSVEEATDIAMLGIDGLWRQVAEVYPEAGDADLALMVMQAYRAKLTRNQSRKFERTAPDVPAEGRPGKWKPSAAVFDVIAERCRQVEGEGMSAEKDDAYGDGEMAAAGAAYAFSAATAGRYLAADPVGFWPWSLDWWKPRSPREDLVRAGALILAEIEKIDRDSAR